MSVRNREGFKVLLPRGPDDFWASLRTLYERDDNEAWRQLAMLALRENAHWPIGRIACAFRTHATQVRANLNDISADLRNRLPRLAGQATRTPL